MHKLTTGNKFGNLTVIEFVGSRNVNRGHYWKVRCDCGKKKEIIASSLIRGITISCGCINIKHGHAKKGNVSPTYRSWCGMKHRCNAPRGKSWENYGGRGIKVCEQWLKFENFLEDMGEKPEGLTLERIDNNGNYEPANCKWIPLREQAGNKRVSVFVNYKDTRRTIAEWSRVLQINVNTLRSRLKSGWAIKKAFATL
ncbi:hypothetical protein LCGC14_1256200 [marine sediment metagenome]|uniref:Uncharacterized protein n=1 Tax=marine sediment metagenome TaxID=412755 RepID=A0A0F9L4T1_9ZZZZ